ncbi:HAD-IIA family hydrolase [Clostridium sp. LBM24168]
MDDMMKTILKELKCFILDLDGTVYLGNRILDGSLKFLEELRKDKIEFKFFTNNSSKNSKFYVNKIRKMGFDVTEDMILTSNQVIIDYIKKNMFGRKIFLLGNKYLKDDFIEAGIDLVTYNADIVAVGFDTSMEYENVSKACDFVRNGADFLGVNPDFNCPVEHGFIPDCGSICSMITASTGVKPEFFGKPSYHTLKYILDNTRFDEDEIAFVGDRLYTDIAIGRGNNSVTILVLSGEAKLDDIAKSDIQPTLIFNSLGDVGKILIEIYQ